jgi:hypothetical protein
MRDTADVRVANIHARRRAGDAMHTVIAVAVQAGSLPWSSTMRFATRTSPLCCFQSNSTTFVGEIELLALTRGEQSPRLAVSASC